jgi:type IV fimbrial biogenesis protein FimT
MDTKATGFTLIELLMTIAIASIVMALAMPSFRYVTNSNRIAGEINGLLGDLQFARAEAIKEGQNVTVCMSKGGQTCDTTGNAWHSGWIVYSNPTGTTIPAAGFIFRVQSTFTSTDTFLASPAYSSITYNREGYAVGITGNGTLIELHDFTANSNWTRCLSVNLSGQLVSEKFGQNVNGGATCN